MGIREDLQAMGFPADLVSAACFKFPNNPDRAADFALNPPPNWQLTAARDAGNWDPLPSPRTDQPYVPWTDPPSNTNDNWALVPSSNSNRNRRQSPPPSRPEPLPSYHADSQVQSGPAQLVSRNHLSGGNTAQEDDELAKAIAMSMSQSAPIPQQEPFQTTWSHPTESMDDSTPAPATWSHHEYAQQEQQPSRTQFPNPDSAALDALVASAMRDITTEPNSFHDDMQERSLRDEIRAKSPHAPVELRVPARHLLALPTLVQALYADAHFRNALLALPLHFTSQEQSYDGFSKGSMSPTLAPQEISDLTLARQLRILKSLQRLFVFMRHTKRRRIAIVDLCGALEGSYDNRHLQDWPDAKVALSALRDIMEAWMNAIQHIHLTSKVDRAWQRIRDVPMTSGRPGQTPNTSIGDLSESPPAEELSIPQIPLDLSTSTTHLYDAIESAFAHSGCYIVQQPETMIMSLDRSNLPQSQTHILTLVKTLQMDRALWKNRFTVLHAIKQKEEMQQKKETIEKEKERVQNIHVPRYEWFLICMALADGFQRVQGKDLLQALEVSVKYFDFHAKPTDDTHAAKQQSMKEQLRRLLDDLKAKLAGAVHFLQPTLRVQI